MIFAGLIFFSLKILIEKKWFFLIPTAFSYFFIWILWRAGIWGGGDAKLVTGIILLGVSFSGIFFISYFFISIALVSLVHYFIFGMVEAFRRKSAKFFTAILFIFISSSSTYLVMKIIKPSLSILVGIITFFICGDIASSFLPCKKNVKLSEEIIGEYLAETIGLRDNELVRIEKEQSLILRILKQKRREMDEIIAKPNYFGISEEEINSLRKYCNEIKIFITYPMAPLIFFALLLTVLIKFLKINLLSIL
ncbi:MAG TPA: hypothetical protein ENI33_00485 [Thermoplasmatales archaeon]|nr:hypothetical protein [Thermoplasmatales archaeon]